MILGPFKGQIGSTYNLIKLCFQKVQPLIAPYLSCSSALFLSLALCFNVYGTGESSPLKDPSPLFSKNQWMVYESSSSAKTKVGAKQADSTGHPTTWEAYFGSKYFCTSDVWWPNGVCSCVDKKWAFERIPKVPEPSYINPLCSESSELGACPLSYHT